MSGHDEALDRIAATLADFGVRFVVVGGYALDVQDYDIGYRTEDIDMAIDSTAENFDALSAALKALNAEIQISHDEHLPFNHTGETLRTKTLWNLVCEHGRFDIATRYSPDMTFEDFAANSHPITIVVDGERHTIQAADVHDIMHSKRAANRVKDRGALDLLETQLRRRTRPAEAEASKPPST